MQIDFGEKRVRIAGVAVTVFLLAAVLSYSRRLFVKAFLCERQDEWREGIAAAFLHFGGVPRTSKGVSASFELQMELDPADSRGSKYAVASKVVANNAPAEQLEVLLGAPRQRGEGVPVQCWHCDSRSPLPPAPGTVSIKLGEPARDFVITKRVARLRGVAMRARQVALIGESDRELPRRARPEVSWNGDFVE